MSVQTEETRKSIGESTINLLDLAIIVVKYKKLVLGLPILMALITIVVALLSPKIYTATARLLPPQQKESSVAAMLGALAAPAAGAGAAVGQALGLRSPSDLYVGVLKSRTIADRLTDRFGLLDLYHAKTRARAREVLKEATHIASGKDGIISIEVDDEDPRRAADMANAYVEELDHMMQGLAVTEASQRRLFFEKQLAQARDQFASAEAALQRAMAAKGISAVEAQGRTMVNTTEQLRAQIAVKEIQLHAMGSYATGRNPEAVRLGQELASMKVQLASLEGGGRELAAAAESTSGLETLRKLREVKFLEFTVELLTKQYEIAKIDEARNAVLIQVVDKAIPPDKKSKPKTTLIVLLSTTLGVFVAILIVVLLEVLEKVRTDPSNEARLKVLRSYLRWGRTGGS